MDFSAGIIKFKNFLFAPLDKDNMHNRGSKEAEPMQIKKTEIELPALVEYEVRRPEVEESSESIDGIFYLYGGAIIADHYSECCAADTDNLCRKNMNHDKFYINYMRKKFDGLRMNDRSIPRGRVTGNMLYLDFCYIDDTETIAKIKKLYRLPDAVTLVKGKNYSCPACKHIADNFPV